VSPCNEEIGKVTKNEDEGFFFLSFFFLPIVNSGIFFIAMV